MLEVPPMIAVRSRGRNQVVPAASRLNRSTDARIVEKRAIVVFKPKVSPDKGGRRACRQPEPLCLRSGSTSADQFRETKRLACRGEAAVVDAGDVGEFHQRQRTAVRRRTGKHLAESIAVLMEAFSRIERVLQSADRFGSFISAQLRGIQSHACLDGSGQGG